MRVFSITYYVSPSLLSNTSADDDEYSTLASLTTINALPQLIVHRECNVAHYQLLQLRGSCAVLPSSQIYTQTQLPYLL